MPTSGRTSAQGPFSDGNAELNDYWDAGNIPAPSQFSDYGSPYPTRSPPPRISSTYSDPFRSTPPPPRPIPISSPSSSAPQPSSSTSRGTYAPVAPADTEMNDYEYNSGSNARAGTYANVDDGLRPSDSWNEKPAKRSRWLFWGAIVGGAALVIAGVVAGIVIGTHKSSSNASKSSGTTSSGNGGTSSSDPSKFTKNPDLHHSFYGFAYTPQGAILPDCGANISNVIQDIQIMSQLTTRIRTYGSDCNVSSLILDAIAQTKTNVSVYLGIYISDDDTVYQRQRDLTLDAIKQFGTDHVAGITVGNEFILDNLTAAGLTDPTSSTGIAAAEFLKTKISDVRTSISSLSLSKTIPIGTADAGGSFNTDIIEACDYCMANVHPWFASVTIDDAAGWTAEYFDETDVALAKTTTNDPVFYIAETGWPTNSSTAEAMTDGGGAEASIANLNTFMQNFVCQANTNGTGYFFFEFMDEPWKTVQYGGVEGYWGVFDENRNLKSGLTIPDCVL